MRGGEVGKVRPNDGRIVGEMMDGEVMDEVGKVCGGEADEMRDGEVMGEVGKV